MTERKTNKVLKVFALGGLCEVGKNCYVLEYNNQIIIIDSGLIFPDEQLFGVDAVIPDFQYLIENQEKIVGLFITHGHEDHIGSIPYLLKQVAIKKIYASGIAIDLINLKLQEHHTPCEIIPYNQDSIFQFKDFKVSFIRVTHSIPDAYSIKINTPVGTVIHSGDYKIDFTPIGPGVEFDKLAKAGSEGVRLLLADSTNSEHEGFTSSEMKVSENIKQLFSSLEGRVIIATFASNVYRIQQIVEASIENNRKVAVFGRSMAKTLEVGLNLGYISNEKNIFIDPKQTNRYKDNQLTLLCTGSQGEAMAALSRIANGSHRQIKIQPNDTVIFSSNPIPGNAGYVNNTINQLYKRGANVIINSSLTDTHTTGHASMEDQQLLFNLVKPECFMPIHGEYRMLKIQSNTAIRCGVDENKIFVMNNGDILNLTSTEAYISGKVQTSNIYLDGNDLNGLENVVLKERKMLSEDGLFAICFVINTIKKTITNEPTFISKGFIYLKNSENLTSSILKQSKDFLNNELKKSKVVNLNNLRTSLSEFVSKIIFDATERKPIVLPILMKLA